MKRIVATLGLCLSVASTAGAASATWLEIKSPNFTVVTNSSEKDGRKTAWQFEQIRQALKIIWPWAKVDGGRPITIFAVKDEATLKGLGPQYWEGKRYRPNSFWVGDMDRTFIALRTDLAEPDDVGENPYQTAYWCYVNIVFHRSMPVGAPAWYSRGVTDVLSNTIVRDKEIHVGRLIPGRLQEARSAAAIPIDQFLSVTRGSKYLTQEVDASQFEAQSWAFVHFLMFGNRGENGSKVDRFNQLLLSGAAADVAMKEAFGPDMAPYHSGMREYIKRQVFTYGRIPLALSVKTEGFASRTLAPADSAILRSRLLVAMGRPVEARAAAAEALASDAKSAGASEVEGFLQDRAGHPDEAKESLAKAVELGSQRAQVYYRLAQLTRPASGSDPATNQQTAGYLRRAVELEPEYANALSFLADVTSDLGKPEDAVNLALRAIKAEPDVTYHRMAMARALWNSQQYDDAVAVARTGLTLADNDREREGAQRFLDFTAKAPRATPRAQTEPSPPAAASTTSQASIQAPIRITPSAPAAEPTPDPHAPIRLSSLEGVVGGCIVNKDNAACVKALPLLSASCDRKPGEACRALGSLYDGGFGVPMNKMRAAAAYDLGCSSGGDKESCARYAVLEAQGQGVQKNTPRAMATLQKLCGEQVADACIGWALLLSSGTEHRDIPKARALLDTACSAGHSEACRIVKSLPAK